MAEGVRTIAFYLPQFHTIPENDLWWGDGFTEWTNVRRAVPAFRGHNHPKRPAELGEYDLRELAVLSKQAHLAQANGIDAFCFYYYWFAGKRLLEAPLEQYLEDGPNFPFCLSWANENWSRRWDGKERQLLISQDYSRDTPLKVFSDLARYFSDPRYLRANGRLVLVVHRADHLPRPREFVQIWRDEAERVGLGALYLIAAETRPNLDPRTIGFDAVAEFPPVGSNTMASAHLVPPRGLKPSFRGRLMSYPRTAQKYMRRPTPAFRRHPGVMPSWDNTARRGDNATIYLDSSPKVYAEWLHSARLRELDQTSDGLVFVNAWNEWAEGAYLEPDMVHGMAYLHATRLDASPAAASCTPTESGPPNLGWCRSLALSGAASVLNLLRRLQDFWRRHAQG